MKYITGTRGAITAWVSRRPRWQSRTIISAGGITAGSSVGHARASIRAGENASLEKRVEVLEKNVDALEREAGAIRVEMAAKHKELTAHISDQASRTQSKVRELTDKVESVVAGGLAVETMGVMFFLWGVFISTTSPELVGGY